MDCFVDVNCIMYVFNTNYSLINQLGIDGLQTLSTSVLHTMMQLHEIPPSFVAFNGFSSLSESANKQFKLSCCIEEGCGSIKLIGSDRWLVRPLGGCYFGWLVRRQDRNATLEAVWTAYMPTLVEPQR